MIQRRNLFNFFLLLLPIVYIFIYKFFLLSNVLKYSEFISSAFMILLVFLTGLCLGFRKNKENIFKKNIRVFIITAIILYFSLTYCSGLLLGFLKNSYSLKINTLVNNVFCPLIFIICLEMYRYIMISSNKDKKYMVFLATIVIILLDLFLNVNLNNINNISIIFKVFTVHFLPLVFKNILLSYLSYWIGYQISLIYHLIMGMYIYIIPIFPDLGDFGTSIVGILFPFIVYMFVSKMVNEYEYGVEHVFEKNSFGLIDILGLSTIVVIVGLVSGKLPVYTLGIVSQSMNPTIARGDAVIIKKVKSVEDLEVGKILVFEKEGKQIVHRYVELKEEDGKKCYVTKGDASANNDSGCLEYEDINGTVLFKVPKLAYPRIFVSELFGGDEE